MDVADGQAEEIGKYYSGVKVTKSADVDTAAK